MHSFALTTADDHAQAATLLADKRFSLPVLKAGGMDLVDHLKEGLMAPDVVINIKRAGRAKGKPAVREGKVPGAGGAGLEIDAACTLAEIIESSLVAKLAPVLAQSVSNAATPQVRNVATAAGNLLQRPRCWYYRHEQFDCLKKGGSQCFAAEGENAYHAIFGPGPCHIVHPSNLAPALMVCNAKVHLTGSSRASIPIADLFHMPEKGILSEHNLQPGEVVTRIDADAQPTSGFWTIKAKASFDWPLAFAAAALTIDGGRIKSARVCAGAVAPVPWVLPKVEAALVGLEIGDEAGITKAAALSIDGAKPMRDNAYKLKLLPVAVKRAVLRATGRDVARDLGLDGGMS